MDVDRKMAMFGDSDIETFSEASSDDQDDIFSIYAGHAQSILSSLEDSIGKIDDFLSFERGFMHGDIVRPIGNSKEQMGRIVNVEMVVDLENVFGKFMKDVRSSKLLRMRSILVGDYVINGPWIGRVEEVVDNVSIVFDDGTKCEIMATKQSNLLPISPNLLDDSLYPYHPGQRVKISLQTKSKPAGWLHGISRKRHNEGTVFSVRAGLVYVDWISSAMVGINTSLPPPTRRQDPINLTLLSCFPNANWQLGDWCILPFADENRETDGEYCLKFDDIFSIVKKKIKVDVMWQDGSCSRGLDSHSLFPVSVVNAHDFFPGQFVLEKTSSDEVNIHANRRRGFVSSVDSNERTVKVKWKSTDVNAKELNTEGEIEETVSAYELVEHPDFSFNIGDIVFRSDMSHLDDTSTLGKEGCGTDFSGIHHQKCFLFSIGNVTGLKDGDVEVQWASGVTRKVAPYEILRMEKDDGSVAAPVFQEENVVEASDELADYEKISVEDKDSPDSLGIDTDAVNCQNVQRNSSLFGFSQAAMGFLTTFAGTFFGSHGSSSLSQPTSCSHVIDQGKFASFDEQDVLESRDMFSGMLNRAVRDFDAYGNMNLEGEHKERSEYTELAEIEGSRQFRQFDVVKGCFDHHFVDGVGEGASLSQMKKSWLKKVQHEWSLLENDLPGTIYVRIYEERMDLLRAAIVGAPGTPYHDGLFFFDILLPPDYPQVPPLVHYHSGGLRLNPNLYESGKVCLSLLNTWTGSGTEVWNPRSSTILQVLVSLQALVLNAKPYFNEAGYDNQIGRAEGEKNSVSYNENAFLGTFKSMLYILRKPPKHFEGLVEEHFARRSQHILSACKGYMEGAPIGFETGVKHEKGNSTGFKIMLAKLFPKLTEAFSQKGIDCSRFIEPEK